jgi:hydrogenase maturation protease
VTDARDVLLMGFGNPGRRDDGLGPAFARAVERMEIPGLTVDADYQLTVEDAATLSGHRFVVFADADRAGPAPFSLARIEPREDGRVSSHSIAPDALLALADALFGARPESYLLGIRGYDFDSFEESFTAEAAANLAQALRFMQPVLRERSFRAAARGYRSPAAPAEVLCNGDAQCEKESL